MAVNRGNTKQYVVPNGKVDFALFPIVNGVEQKELSKGLRYLGATKEFTLTQENETIEHKSSECGFNVTDLEIITGSKLTGTVNVDNISSENLAMFFAGDVEKVVQTAKTNQTYVVKVYPSYGYKVGATPENPNGIFAAEVTKVETFASEANAKAGTSVVATMVKDTEFEFNENTGYLTIGDRTSQTKVAEEGTWARVTYNLKNAKRDVVISKGQSIIGEVIFHGCNAYGENREYRIPKARLAASGDFQLKGGEDFVSMTFDITALKTDNEPLLYINGVAQTA